MSNAWCDEHWKPYAAKEANGIAAQVFLMHMIHSDERFMRLCGGDPESGIKADGSADTLNAAMAKIAPACCWIDPVKLQAVFVASQACNPIGGDDLDGPALAKLQLEAFKMWQAKNRGEMS